MEPPTCVAVDIYDWAADQEVPDDWAPTRLRLVSNAKPPGITQMTFSDLKHELSWGGRRRPTDRSASSSRALRGHH